MERLTARDYVAGMEIGDLKLGIAPEQAYDKLSFYEDAEEQGKLVILPVALSQQVWFNSWEGVQSGTISNRQQKADGTWKVRITHNKNRYVFDRSMSTLGNDWFLTSEEAEKIEI